MMDWLLGVVRTLILSLVIGSAIANRSDQDIPSIGGERETTSGGVSPDDSTGYCSTDDVSLLYMSTSMNIIIH